jgi:DNA-binding phage protein
MPKSVPFEQVLNNYLQDPKKAMSYLKSALEENDPELFQAALQDVINLNKEAIAMTSIIPKLAASLQRHGIDEEAIDAVITEISSLNVLV